MSVLKRVVAGQKKRWYYITNPSDHAQCSTLSFPFPLTPSTSFRLGNAISQRVPETIELTEAEGQSSNLVESGMLAVEAA